MSAAPPTSNQRAEQEKAAAKSGHDSGKRTRPETAPWLRIIPARLRSRLSRRPELAKILDNIGWLFLDRALRMGIGLLVTLWVARYLGPERFGLLSYGLAYIALFTPLATLGLSSIAVRDIVRAPADARDTVGTTVLLQLAGGSAACVASIAIVHQLRSGDGTALSIVSILALTLIFNGFGAVRHWFEARVESKYTVRVENGIFVAASGVKIAVILAGGTVVAFAWVSLGQVVAVALGLLMLYGVKSGSVRSLRGSVFRAKELLRDSWPLILSGLSVMVYMKIDQVMLGQLVGDDVVGIYAAAARVSEIWYFIPTAVVASVFPAIVKAKERSEQLYLARLQLLLRVLVVVTLAVAIPMFFLSDFVVVVLFGETYAAAGPVLAIHIWSAVFVFIGVASGKWFIIENRQILSFQRTFLGALVNVALNILWIPRMGAVGAAYATVVSYAVAGLFADLLQAETRPLFLMKLRAFNVIALVRRV